MYLTKLYEHIHNVKPLTAFCAQDGASDTKKYETLQCCQWQEVARMKLKRAMFMKNHHLHSQWSFHRVRTTQTVFIFYFIILFLLIMAKEICNQMAFERLQCSMLRLQMTVFKLSSGSAPVSWKTCRKRLISSLKAFQESKAV